MRQIEPRMASPTYQNWRGHLWQGRFASFPMDEAYLYAATLR